MGIKLLVFVSISTVLLTNGYAQTTPNLNQKSTQLIKGRIVSLHNDVSDVLIINVRSKKATISDSLGNFTIEAKLRDSVRFMAVQYITKEIVITPEVFLEKTLVVHLIENIISLNEVTVTPYNLTGKIEQDLNRIHIDPLISAGTLNLPSAEMTLLTQSERLLLMADRGEYARLMTLEEKLKKNVLGFLTIGVMVNVDKTINRLSGTTKLLEDRVARDQNMAMEKKIVATFSKQAIAEGFDIPEVMIDGFLTFCLSQKEFSALHDSANTDEIWKYLAEKSVEFKTADLLKE